MVTKKLPDRQTNLAWQMEVPLWVPIEVCTNKQRILSKMLREGVMNFSHSKSSKVAEDVMSVVIVQFGLGCTYPKIVFYYHNAFCVITSV